MSTAGDLDREYQHYDKRAFECLERYAKMDSAPKGNAFGQELVLQEAQVWATLAQATATRLVAEAMPGVVGPLPVEVQEPRGRLL